MSSNEDSSQPFRVTFFGDSICVGQGVSIHSGWVTRIASQIEAVAQDINNEIIVTNSSINGNTTRQALERMPYDIQSHGVDILIVQFGLNDCNHWLSDKGLPRVSPEAFAANINEIIRRGNNFGASRIFVNNNHPTARSDQFIPGLNISLEDSNKNYNDIIRNMARHFDENVIFTDIESIFYNEMNHRGHEIDYYLLRDKLHLSRAGHDLYFNVVGQRIAEMVESVIKGSGS